MLSSEMKLGRRVCAKYEEAEQRMAYEFVQIRFLLAIEHEQSDESKDNMLIN